MSKPTVEPGGSPGLTSQIEVLREVLRDPRPPDLGDAAAVAHPESLLEPYLGQFFEGTAVIAPDGRFRLFTAGLEHITGRPAQEVGSLKELVTTLAPTPEQGRQQWEPFERYWHRQESPEQLIEIVNTRGEHRWLRIKLHRVSEDTLVHVLDITAIHTLRTHTPYNIEHYRALLDNLGIGIYSIDDPASGSISYSNPAARQIMGLPDQHEPGDFSSFMLYEKPADRIRLLRALIADGLARSRTVRIETNLLRVDDRRPVPLRITATATYDDEGKMSRVDGAIEDLTPQRQLEQEQRRHELLLRSLFRDTAVGISIGALDGTFLAVNPAFCALTGYAEDELVGRSNDTVTHPEDRHLTQRHIGTALAAGRLTCRFEKRYLHKDGTVIRVSVVLAAVKDESGAVVAGFGLSERLPDEV